MKTIKVKPWGEGQGDFVLVNEEDFNPEAHQLFDDAPAEKPKAARKAKQPEQADDAPAE